MKPSERGCLFIVSTPIGNLGDITYRAVQTLQEVDLVAAEDTRRTRILLNHYAINTTLTSFNSYNQERKTSHLIDRLKDGDQIALVSDAGTPGVSDPLYRLVTQAVANDIEVTSLPGPSSVLAALTLSGLPVNRFWFEGFLPRKKRRRKTLELLSQQPATVVLFESPLRIEKTLEEILEVFGDRQVALSREITKMHEETLRGSLMELLNQHRGRKWKGEITLVISGSPNSKADKGN